MPATEKAPKDMSNEIDLPQDSSISGIGAPIRYVWAVSAPSQVDSFEHRWAEAEIPVDMDAQRFHCIDVPAMGDDELKIKNLP